MEAVSSFISSECLMKKNVLSKNRDNISKRTIDAGPTQFRFIVHISCLSGIQKQAFSETTTVRPPGMHCKLNKGGSRNLGKLPSS